MRILIPYTSRYLIDDFFSDFSINAFVSVDFEYLGTLKPRSASKPGIPHVDYKVRLFPKTDKYRKFSGKRRSNAVCWHGHRAFMRLVFSCNEDATIRTALAEYRGWDHFEETHEQTNDQQFNWRSNCKC